MKILHLLLSNHTFHSCIAHTFQSPMLPPSSIMPTLCLPILQGVFTSPHFINSSFVNPHCLFIFHSFQVTNPHKDAVFDPILYSTIHSYTFNRQQILHTNSIALAIQFFTPQASLKQLISTP